MLLHSATELRCILFYFRPRSRGNNVRVYGRSGEHASASASARVRGSALSRGRDIDSARGRGHDSDSGGNFGVKLMLELLTLDELLDTNPNVMGRPCGKGPEMEPLVQDRISEIKEICLSYVETPNQKKLSQEWKKIRDAMSKKLSQLRKEAEQRRVIRRKVIRELIREEREREGRSDDED